MDIYTISQISVCTFCAKTILVFYKNIRNPLELDGNCINGTSFQPFSWPHLKKVKSEASLFAYQKMRQVFFKPSPRVCRQSFFRSKSTSREGWAREVGSSEEASSELPDTRARRRERRSLGDLDAEGRVSPRKPCRQQGIAEGTDERSEERLSLLNREGDSKGGDVPLPLWPCRAGPQCATRKVVGRPAASLFRAAGR